MLSFKPALLLSSFIKKLFSSSSLSARRVVSSAYLRLLICVLEILILTCASSCPAFHMTYSAAAKSRQSCPTLFDGSPPGSHPWDFPGKNTGVGCHFLLQGMKVKSESEVAQSCPTLHDPMDCRLPGSSVHRISQARVLEWGAIAFSVTLQSFKKLFFSCDENF